MISAVSIGLILIISFFPYVTPLFSVAYGDFAYEYYVYYRIIEFFFFLLLGVGMLLASFGYREIKNKYSLLFGNAGFAIGIIASFFVFSTVAVLVITSDYVILVYPPPLIYSIRAWLRLLNLIFFGLTHIVWGIAHFKSKKFCKKPKLSLATSGFFIASGVVLLSTFSPEIGLVLSFVSLVFALRAFLAF